MSLFKKKFLKNFLSLFVLTLVMFVVVGCTKDDKIELSFAQNSYEVTVGEEIEVIPTVTKGEDVKEVILIYSSGDVDVATYVDGKVKGIAVGEIKVKVAVDGRPTVYKEVTIKVVAKQVVTYEIVYHLNQGTNSSSNPVTYTEADLPITLENPTRSGYKFLGWFDNAEMSGNPITSIAKGATGNKALYAKWEKEEVVVPTFTVNYNLDGGTNHNENPATFKETDLPVTLKEPTKDGYDFLGWFLTADFTGDAVTTITEAANVVLYARWKEIVVIEKYTITYELDGGTLTAPVTEFTAENLPLTLPTPTKDGFDFLGWFLSSDHSGNAVTQVTEAANVVVYAKWGPVEKTYEIIYHLDGGTLPQGAPTHYKESETVVLPTPTKDGSKFFGWFLDEDHENGPVTQIDTGSTGLKVFYAKFQEQIISSITYHVDGGKFIANVDDLKTEFMLDYYEFMKPAMSFNDFVHGAGKTTGFEGPWAIKESNNSVTIQNLYAPGEKAANPNSSNFINQPKYNERWLAFFDLLDTLVNETNNTQTLWGSTWTGNIRFREFFTGLRYGNDPRLLELDIVPRSLVTEFDNFSEGFDLITPVKDGYIFGGWYDNADFSGEAITKIAAGTIGDKVLYARWLPIMHKVTFDVEGKTTVVDAENNKPVAKPADPVKDGYDFVGWFLGDQKFDFSTKITGPITLTAQFREIDYVYVETIAEFKAALTNEKMKVIYLLNDLVSDEKKLLLMRDGVTIDGQGFTISYAGTEGWGSEYILHVYNAKDIVIKNIKLTGGDAALLVNGSIVRLEGEIDVSGNEFGGIEVSLGIGLADNPQLTLAPDLILINSTEAYALPTIWEDKITNTVVGAEALHINDAVKPEQVQYFLDINNASQVIWTVTFDVDGTTNVVEVIDGAKVALPDNPTKEGHLFIGWFLEEVEFDAETVITENITLVAKWEEVELVLADAKAALLADNDVPTYFPYGMFPDNKITGLPSSIDGFPTVTVTWAPVDTAEFTADFVLKKQRMLYYETPIIATLSSPGETDVTVEFKVNIGLVETKEAYGISSVSRAGATSFDVAAYNAENGFDNAFDGGTNITGRNFLFGGLIFKSNFKWGSVTADFYFFVRKGNIMTISDEHLTTEGDVHRITGINKTAWHESSFSRFVHNSTNKDGVIKGDQLKAVFNYQENTAYHIYIIDGEGNITLKHTGANAAHEYVIPAGGYIIERGYIDGNASNSGKVTAAVLGFFNNATKLEIIKVDVHANYK